MKRLLQLSMVGFLFVGAVACDGTDDDTQAEEITADDSEREETEAPEEAEAPTTTETTQPAWTDPIELQGQGDDIVPFEIPEGGVAVVRFTHSGGSNFQVATFDAAGQRIEGLVNEIGQYEGTRPLNFASDPVEFEIKADGAWTATISSLLTLPPVTPPRAEGSGDQVLFLGDVDATSVQATHDGTSNFQVTAWGDSREGLINEIGTYDGRVRLPSDALILEVVADGNWSFDFG